MKPPTVTLNSAGDYWQARWIDPWTGAERRKGLGHKAKVSERRARELCQRIAVEIAQGSGDNRDAPPLDQWAERYLELRGELKPKTVKLYRETIHYLVSYFEPERPIDCITELDASEWRAWLRGKGLTEQTVRKHLRHAKAMFGDRHGAQRFGLIASSPFRREVSTVPKVAKNWGELTPEDFERLIDSLTSWPMRCLVGLTRLAGLRLGEAQALRWSDIDWDQRCLSIWPRGDGTEGTKQAQRMTPIIPRLHDLLLEAFEYAKEGDDLVAGVSDTVAYNHLRRALQSAGMPYPRKPYHTFRKNCRSDLAAMGYAPDDIEEWLGHDKQISQDFYHRTRSDTWRKVTGVGPSETDELKAEIRRLRARLDRQESDS